MTTDSETKIHDLTWSFDNDAPQFRDQKWPMCFDDQLASTPFSLTTSADLLFSLPLGEGNVKFEVWLTKDEVWKRYTTLS